MMEHRSSERVPLAIDICLKAKGSERISAKSSNMSMGGMLVATDEPSFLKNAFVDVSMRLGQGNKIKDCAIQAMVVYRGSGGVGLMFSDMDQGLRKMLKDLISNSNNYPQVSHSLLKANSG